MQTSQLPKQFSTPLKVEAVSMNSSYLWQDEGFMTKTIARGDLYLPHMGIKGTSEEAQQWNDSEHKEWINVGVAKSFHINCMDYAQSNFLGIIYPLITFCP